MLPLHRKWRHREPSEPSTCFPHDTLPFTAHAVFLMGPTGCGRSEVYRVLAKALTTGCSNPVNPYVQANNKKKVGKWLGCGWRTGAGAHQGATLRAWQARFWQAELHLA